MEKEKLDIIRHSTSHILAYAVKELFKDVKFGIGPTIDDGFYYDFDLNGETFSLEDLDKIEQKMKEIIKKNLEFNKKEVKIEEAENKLKDQPYKLELVEDLKNQGEKKVSFYQVGDFEDLCRGPHVSSTKELGNFKLLRVAGAYWKGSEKNAMLQRIYGTAFGTKEELAEYLKMLQEAEKRDHNKLGKELGLFITSDLIGQGLPLLTPKGSIIKQILQRWIEDEEKKRGYQLTMTPYLAKSDLYKVSGHWDHYRDGMFVLDASGEEMALRPMTCPFQFQIYKAEKRSYRDLPIRYNETSTLFRNESSGEMHGLIRLRQFTLSEGHLICRMDQLEEEFEGVLDLIQYILKTLGLSDFWYRFSKWDPKNNKGKYIDNPKAWEQSEKTLKKILDKNKMKYEEAEGEAAFYGPKLDIQMKNVFGKEDTIITVQIDFALPEKFDMAYIDEKGQEVRPIVIHRSSIGAYERTMALLIERYAGAFPTWLSPNQVKIIPVSEKFNDYGIKVKEIFEKNNIRVELDDSNESLGKRIRNAEKEKTPYILVVGEKEKSEDTVSVRKRGVGDLGAKKAGEFVKEILEEIKNRE
ncbi:MAG: threonine--tRNA ligase [Patescibacteria group bacterium]